MKILVTGGSGFIGAWIARRLLADGHQVRVFDLSDRSARPDRGQLLQQVVGAAADTVEWVTGDIASPTDVAGALQGCGGVIHLAGILTPDCRANPVLGAQVNLIGTVNVFEAARHAGLKRVVYCSTAGVYGPDDGSRPAPATLYGVYKFASEGVGRVYRLEYGISNVGFRPFIVYGPGRESGASAGPTLACKAAVQGQPYEIPYTGSAGMVYVEDVAAAFVAALAVPKEGAHVFNLAGQTASMERIMECIRAAVPGARVTATGAPLPIASELAPDGLREQIPGLPDTSLERGISATVDFYKRTLR